MDESTQERILELFDEDKSANEIVDILKKEDNIKVSKATVNRCRKLITALGDDKKLSPDERKVYLSYMEKQNKKEQGRTAIPPPLYKPTTMPVGFDRFPRI